MKYVKRIIALGLVFSIAAVAAAAALLISLSSNLPQIIKVEDYEPLLVSEIFDREGEKIGEFFREKRVLVPIEQIPEKLIQAFIAAEDSSFYEHHGINLVAIFRAMLANIKAGRHAQGASTITQQVAKSLLLTPEKTYIRKLKEMILAYRMETHLTKPQIMYLYLNQIYFGQGAYGVAVAADIYFRKKLEELNLAEMALLAGLPQAPSRYSPVRNASSAKARQRYVLSRMVDDGYVTKQEADEAAEKVVTVFKRQNYKQLAPYYLETVRQLLVAKLGEKTVLDKGIRVYTGLDLEKQLAARDSLQEGLRELDKRQGFRGPKKNLASPEEIAQFLIETRDRLLEDKSDEKVILPDGTNPPLPEFKMRSLPETQVAAGKPAQAATLPAYIGKNDIVNGVVVEVDDKWGLVRVRFAEGLGMIDFESMKWARKPNPETRFEWDLLKKPSQALKAGDVIEVRVIGEQFYSPRIEKELKALEQKNKKFERPTELSQFAQWARLQLEQEPVAEASLISFDQENMDVLAMVGGYDFNRSEFNRALQAARQTGSAFKAIVYAAAMDKNYTPSTLITDAPIVYEEEIDSDDGTIGGEKETQRWKPTNHSRRFGGEILFRNALIRSLNIPTVKILQDIGVNWVADYARRLGIFSPLNMDFTLGLGSSGVTLYEVTKVFSEFGRLGRRMRPMLIHRVVSREGEVLLENVSLDDRFEQEISQYQRTFEERRQEYLKLKSLAEQEASLHQEEAEFAQSGATDEQKRQQQKSLTSFKGIPPLFFEDPEQLMRPQSAYLITSLLQGAVEERFGTGGAARALGHPVAAKTGTTNGYFDGWFIGYTPQVATGVWVGFDQEQTLGKGEVGARNALPIWLDYMKVAHKDLPRKTFSVPSDIIFANIDNETGKLASANTKDYVRQAFIDGTEPKETSDPNQIEDESEFYKEDLSE